MPIIMRDGVSARRELWSTLPAGSAVRLRADQLAELLATLPPPRQRNPALAGALAIVPGLGYAYAGHPQTALSALVLISLFGWTTLHSFQGVLHPPRHHLRWYRA